MKKFLKIFFIALAAIFLILFLAPFLFKGKILEIAKTELNRSLNAKVEFSDLDLSFIKGFPDVYVGLENMKVIGVDTFANDTLISFKTFSVNVDIMSVLGNSGINIKSILLDNPKIHAIVLKDSSANWNIVKPSEPAQKDTSTSKTAFNIKLKKFEIKDASVEYDDQLGGMYALIQHFNFLLKGDLGSDQTTIAMNTDLLFKKFVQGGIQLVKDAQVKADIKVDADLKNSVYTLKDNTLAINDLELAWAGKVAMPDSAIDMDLTFGTKKTDFKSVLSLIPAVYSKSFASVQTAGQFKLNGFAKGRLLGKQTPNVGIDLVVENAMFKYPSLPKSAEKIQIDFKLLWNGVNNDSTTVDLNRFYVELGGNPFEANLHVRTPMSDPDIKAGIKGKIDLTSIKDVVPLDSMSIKGIVAANIDMAGRVSMITNKQYEKFKADGQIQLTDFEFASNDFKQGVLIKQANLLFSPKFVELVSFDSKVGKSDFQLKGKVENFIPYVFSNGTVSGQLALNSTLVDVNEFIPQQAAPAEPVQTDTTSLSVFQVPERMHFVFNSDIKTLKYDKLDITNMKGNIELVDQKVVMNNLNMNMLQGSLGMNGEYNTQNIKKPVVDLKLNIKEFDIPSAFTSFTSLEKFAPKAKYAIGKFSMSLAYNSLLDSKMSPVLPTVNGGGSFSSKDVQIKNNPMFTKLGEALQSDKIKNPRFSNVNISFTIKDGRIYFKPFDLKVGNSGKVNVSGDQGLDKTMNYTMNMALPTSELGASFNKVVSGLVSAAASKGVTVNPGSTVDIAALITGTSDDPKVSVKLGNEKGGAKEQVKEAVNQLIDAKKEEAKALLSKKAQDLIAKAQQEADAIKAAAQKAADAVKAEAEKNAQKIEKEASNQPSFLKTAAKKSADKVRNEGNKKANTITNEANSKADAIMQKAQAEADKLK